MATIKGDYWKFYLDGRYEKRLLKHEIEEAVLVERMDSGTPFREAIAEACAKVTVPLETGKRKREWLAVHQADLVGLNADEAYAAYLQGRVDELAYALEQNVLTALGDRFLGKEEDSGDDDDDDDDGEEDDEEDDDEEDERSPGPRRAHRPS
jgi:hypothetical protein